MTHFIHRFWAKVRGSLAAEVHKQLYYEQLAHFLLQHTLCDEKLGVTSDKVADAEVIVSLTSHGRRIYESYLAIESIMQGSILPNRIILWINRDLQKKSLPLTLTNLCKRGLEIRYTDDIGPYTKLIPSLLQYPEAIIVTIDDDILYPYDTIEMLLDTHAIYPEGICSNRVMDVAIDSHGNIASMPTWIELKDKNRISKRNFFEGLAGVLYPPHCFPAEVFEQRVFRNLSPTADDIWFNCMALKAGTQVVPSNHHYLRFPLIFNESVQDSGLWRINNARKTCPHDKQLKAVLEQYHLAYV